MTCHLYTTPPSARVNTRPRRNNISSFRCVDEAVTFVAGEHRHCGCHRGPRREPKARVGRPMTRPADRLQEPMMKLSRHVASLQRARRDVWWSRFRPMAKGSHGRSKPLQTPDDDAVRASTCLRCSVHVTTASNALNRYSSMDRTSLCFPGK